jgi:hypothetical protein
MGSTDEARLQLLFASQDAVQMKGLIEILRVHGIHTVRVPTSLPWRSIGIDSLLMVASADYLKACALNEDYIRENNVMFVSTSAPILASA